MCDVLYNNNNLYMILTTKRVGFLICNAQEIEGLLEKLDFVETSVFTTDVTYVDFLDRVHKGEYACTVERG